VRPTAARNSPSLSAAACTTARLLSRPGDQVEGARQSWRDSAGANPAQVGRSEPCIVVPPESWATSRAKGSRRLRVLAVCCGANCPPPRGPLWVIFDRAVRGFKSGYVGSASNSDGILCAVTNGQWINPTRKLNGSELSSFVLLSCIRGIPGAQRSCWSRAPRSGRCLSPRRTLAPVLND
jgi:hypothetical protein